MAHRRSSFRGRNVPQRRKRLWADLNVASPGATGDIAGTRLDIPGSVGPGGLLTFAAFPSSAAPGLLESTLVRIRGWVSVPKSIPSGTANTGTVNAFGIGFVSEEAAEGGALPNPATQQGQDWDGWMFLRSSSEVPLDAVGTMMDVKAMRKWQSGNSLVFVFGTATDNVAGDASEVLVYSARGLFLLP